MATKIIINADFSMYKVGGSSTDTPSTPVPDTPDTPVTPATPTVVATGENIPFLTWVNSLGALTKGRDWRLDVVGASDSTAFKSMAYENYGSSPSVYLTEASDYNKLIFCRFKAGKRMDCKYQPAGTNYNYYNSSSSDMAIIPIVEENKVLALRFVGIEAAEMPDVLHVSDYVDDIKVIEFKKAFTAFEDGSFGSLKASENSIGTSSSMRYSSPVHLNEGQTIVIKGGLSASSTTVYAAIAKKNDDGTYSSLAAFAGQGSAKNSRLEYNMYTASEGCDVIVFTNYELYPESGYIIIDDISQL